MALDLLGRICIAALFVNALPGKMGNFSGTASFIASKGIPEPLASALLIGAIVVLIVGSVFLVFGSNTILGASLLLIFLVPTTLIFHTNPLELPQLFSNLAVIGALILAITRSTGGSVPSFRSLRARRR
ncbi:MAG: DoxX family protein [Synechococcus sp. BS307-5m-G36]|nr:DoxX family protein [Synechococcus sp. BS307-5m-G36]MBL6880939.1 DoxX family protein [Synechococcus sp. BS30m-G31]